MRRIACSTIVVFLGLLAVGAPAFAAGLATNANFTVLTPNRVSPDEDTRFAKRILERAEFHRARIAREWLGDELPLGVGRTTINIGFSESEISAKTWAKDDPRRKFHIIYITMPPDGPIDEILAHEVAHTVLATRYPHPSRLAAWLEEAVASRYDNLKGRQIRQRALSWFVSTGNWPRIEPVINAETISANDQQAYAVSVSIGEYLISLDGKSTFIQFGETARQTGWDAALSRHYGIRNVAQLQQSWQKWLTASQRLASRSR